MRLLISLFLNWPDSSSSYSLWFSGYVLLHWNFFKIVYVLYVLYVPGIGTVYLDKNVLSNEAVGFASSCLSKLSSAARDPRLEIQGLRLEKKAPLGVLSCSIELQLVARAALIGQWQRSACRGRAGAWHGRWGGWSSYAWGYFWRSCFVSGWTVSWCVTDTDVGVE